MATVETIVKEDLCSGCGLCAGLSANIQMQSDAAGFLRPVVTSDGEAPTQPGCPGTGATVATTSTADPLWGDVASCHRGWAEDQDVRFNGSSGGALTALSLTLLETGQVDAVLHCGKRDDTPGRSGPRVSRTRAELVAAAGSRYAPSATLAHLSDLMVTGERYAVVGKPCEISALATARSQRPDLAKQFPVLLSFFCAGVPSQHATDHLISELVGHVGPVSDFWYRGRGWPGQTTAITPDGTTRSMSYSDSWGQRLSPELQTRCKFCADGIGMAADVVCADAWDVDKDGYPVFEERPGESAVLTRTALGDDLVATSARRNDLALSPMNLSELDAMQPGQVRRRRTVAARLLGRALAGRRVPRFQGFGQVRAARQAPPRQLLRAFLGAFYRAAFSR